MTQEEMMVKIAVLVSEASNVVNIANGVGDRDVARCWAILRTDLEKAYYWAKGACLDPMPGPEE